MGPLYLRMFGRIRKEKFPENYHVLIPDTSHGRCGGLGDTIMNEVRLANRIQPDNVEGGDISNVRSFFKKRNNMVFRFMKIRRFIVGHLKRHKSNLHWGVATLGATHGTKTQ